MTNKILKGSNYLAFTADMSQKGLASRLLFQQRDIFLHTGLAPGQTEREGKKKASTVTDDKNFDLRTGSRNSVKAEREREKQITGGAVIKWGLRITQQEIEEPNIAAEAKPRLANNKNRHRISETHVESGDTVAERLDCSPSTKANRVQSPAGSLRKWESCRTMLLVGGFSLGSPVFLRPCISALLHTHLTSPSSALNTSLLRAAQKFTTQLKLDHLAEIKFYWSVEIFGLSNAAVTGRTKDKTILTCVCPRPRCNEEFWAILFTVKRTHLKSTKCLCPNGLVVFLLVSDDFVDSIPTPFCPSFIFRPSNMAGPLPLQVRGEERWPFCAWVLVHLSPACARVLATSHTASADKFEVQQCPHALECSDELERLSCARDRRNWISLTFPMLARPCRRLMNQHTCTKWPHRYHRSSSRTAELQISSGGCQNKRWPPTAADWCQAWELKMDYGLAHAGGGCGNQKWPPTGDDSMWNDKAGRKKGKFKREKRKSNMAAIGKENRAGGFGVTSSKMPALAPGQDARFAGNEGVGMKSACSGEAEACLWKGQKGKLGTTSIRAAKRGRLYLAHVHKADGDSNPIGWIRIRWLFLASVVLAVTRLASRYRNTVVRVRSQAGSSWEEREIPYVRVCHTENFRLRCAGFPKRPFFSLRSLSIAIGCCLLGKALSYLTGPLKIRQHRHGSYVIRVQTVNTRQKVIQSVRIGKWSYSVFKYRMSPLKRGPVGHVCKGAKEGENTVKCDNKVPRTTPKVVKGTGEDMLRDHIDSYPTGPLSKDSSCITHESSWVGAADSGLHGKRRRNQSARSAKQCLGMGEAGTMRAAAWNESGSNEAPSLNGSSAMRDLNRYGITLKCRRGWIRQRFELNTIDNMAWPACVTTTFLAT
ncbi:hypothetical protein PR048_017694 [Dryococelus australis]|uniref:Uncharacterized protein n=1 Tax=Dryococelus australis TaxID=614101 RepID=A0ABQ9HA93_9NEOP|nr:hypothetical protein PR048_017694 [Dryococelus australis]